MWILLSNPPQLPVFNGKLSATQTLIQIFLCYRQVVLFYYIYIIKLFHLFRFFFLKNFFLYPSCFAVPFFSRMECE